MPSVSEKAVNSVTSATHFRTAVGGLEIFYREAGPPDAPVVLLLHGFPSSSRTFRNLIPQLAQSYRVIAPDYPAFGHSATPDRAQFVYSFDHIAETINAFLEALGIQQFAMYVTDIGAAVGYRLVLKHGKRLTGIIAQNATAYSEGIMLPWWATLAAYWENPSADHRKAARSYLTGDSIKGQYLVGVRDPSLIDPDNWLIDKVLLDRPGVDEIMLDMLYDIRNNVPTFIAMQEYFRVEQPPALIVTGANDEIFPESTMRLFLQDLPNAAFHALDTGHSALEDKCDEIATLMVNFLNRSLVGSVSKRK